MSELNDNNDLAQRAGFLLTRTCGVSPPRELIGPFLNSLFQVIQESSVSSLLGSDQIRNLIFHSRGGSA